MGIQQLIDDIRFCAACSYAYDCRAVRVSSNSAVLAIHRHRDTQERIVRVKDSDIENCVEVIQVSGSEIVHATVDEVTWTLCK